VGALRKTAQGPVVYDGDKCIGCRYCQYACPFGVPTYQWDDVLGLIRKCEMCFDRVTSGQKPACVASCPNGALRFGKRSERLAQAKAQIASTPDRYIDHVYGEHEVGGTSMLYLSDVPFAQLGFPTFGERTVSGYAETVMQMTPAVAATVATLATGLHLIFRRRQQVVDGRQLEFKLKQAEQRAHEQDQQGEKETEL
jgi:formate dehydrogenase iron-sulfur subunit